MTNAKLNLTGFLGEDAKQLLKEGRSFTVLNIATTDSYPIKDGETTKWVDKETEWHTVFVFSPVACKYANELKKSDKVEVSASLSYRVFKDADGHSRKEAIITGYFIEKIDYNKQDSLFTKQVVQDLAQSLAA